MSVMHDVSRAQAARTLPTSHDAAGRQAFNILRFGFTVAPIVAGLDKFCISSPIGTSTWHRWSIRCSAAMATSSCSWSA